MPDPLRTITAERVAALAAGATLLGSGGGGPVALGELLLRRALPRRGVIVRRARDLPLQAMVVHVGVFGAPDVLAERLINPADMAAAARAVVEQVGGELAAVGALEIGGLNALAAVLAAHELDLPIIDGDLMGRAFPSVYKTTMSVAGHPAAPVALVGPGGDTVVVPTCSDRLVGGLLDSAAAALGGLAALAIYPTSAATLGSVGVPGTLSSCVSLGEAFLSAPAGDIPVLADRLGGSFIFQGRVDELRPREADAPGSVTLTGAGGSVARIDLLEEFLAVTVNGITLARTPDVIVVLSSTSGAVVGTAQVRLGQALGIVALPALHTWPPGSDAVVGPAAFGLDLDVVTR